MTEKKSDVNGLVKKNKDCIGYVEIPGTTISYPVMQTKDNPDFYLNHDFNRNYSFYGTPYLSAYCDVNKSDNLIIYGHNMKNGSMFGSLKQYKNDGFYEKNAYFTVFTEDAAYRYQIFAYSDVPEDSDVYTTGYLPDETFDGFLTELLKSSYKDTGVAVGKDDKVLTLSTCSGDGLRFVVHAVRVDEHESGM